MEGGSGDSESDYYDCATDRSRSSSEEMEDRRGGRGKVGREEVQRVPTIRRFRRIDTERRKIENAGTERGASSVGGGDMESGVSREKETGDGVEIFGYELRAPQNTHALKRLSMDATLQRQEFLRKAEVKSQSMRSKVQDEVMKVLFGPSDAKTPDEEKYEIVEQEEVVRGVGRTGILYRFSMWATLGFITLVLGGRRAQVGCTEFFPSIRERDPVPKVIVAKQIQSP
ncbi:hypothetical protein M758_8G047700 [Ceratodon purpureus]|nr:hypothetical protein M758_8G047700 [Ceratodon purpureus]